MNFVILAGGSGTRLWPLSRDHQPKQLAKLVSEVTMLEDAIANLGALASPQNLYISTNSTFAKLIREIVPSIPANHYIIEPEKRDTGPAMAYVATWMSQSAPDEPMAFIPSDHFIRDRDMYQTTLRAAETMIRETGKLLDISVQPTFPSTTLGYTKVGKLIEDRHGVHFLQFLGHREKPDYPTAKQLLDDGHYLWHASYYMWTPQKFVEAYQQYAPGIGNYLNDLLNAIEAGDSQQLAAVYSQMEKISIDYAVTEKMNPEDVLIIRGDFGWGDLGSWDTVYDELSHTTDSNRNLIKANWHGVDTHDSLVFSTSQRLVATIGLSNIVIVDTPDALLVTQRGRGQDVKKIVTLLKERGADTYL
ncbi:mannose-1-phosphate guanylyltransferase [Candidatus Berkelbacteria bacterium]|nr:mannose-1-phosphate guanylyltransferase [Candidatus Berkelbacteria bacterium]